NMSPALTFYVKHATEEEQEVLLKELRNSPDFRMTTPTLERKMLISSGKYQQLGFVKGIRPDEYNTIMNIRPYLQEKRLLTADLAQTEFPEILLGLSLANRIGVGIGDTVTLVSLLDIQTYTAPSIQCIVRDLFNVTVFDYDYRAYMHLLDMQYLLDEPAYHQIETELTQEKQLLHVQKDWQSRLPASVRLANWWEEHLELFSAMQVEKIATFLVLCLVILLAGFNLIASMVMLLLEKKWEIGILQSMGCGSRDAYRIYFRLGWYTGGLGMVLGLVSALLLLLLQQYFPFFVMPGAEDVYIFRYVPVIVNFWDVLFTVLVVALLISLASLLPARRAARVRPLEAIKTKQ
ncbi:MAG: FtsX-like permease family protein, partial [Candidatus Marinimicrobia bacterium]|nr:FtsX-like permease family protein [Candidatus Neomarinimicrobiota bacterium]